MQTPHVREISALSAHRQVKLARWPVVARPDNRPAPAVIRPWTPERVTREDVARSHRAA